MEQPKFSNQFVRLFLNRHPHSKEFHKKIRNINASFALSSFNAKYDRTINSYCIYSFIVCGQVYHKIYITAHPTQNDVGVFERPLYWQLLNANEAVNQRDNNPFNSRTSTSTMELLEFIIPTKNLYVQGSVMMRQVEDEFSRLTSTQGLLPTYVKLLLRLTDQADGRSFNIPERNEVCAVFTLNANQSYPENKMIVNQRNKTLSF